MMTCADCGFSEDSETAQGGVRRPVQADADGTIRCDACSDDHADRAEMKEAAWLRQLGFARAIKPRCTREIRVGWLYGADDRQPRCTRVDGHDGLCRVVMDLPVYDGHYSLAVLETKKPIATRKAVR